MFVTPNQIMVKSIVLFVSQSFYHEFCDIFRRFIQFVHNLLKSLLTNYISNLAAIFFFSV